MLKYGLITLPCPDADATFLRSVRRGEQSFDLVITIAAEWERALIQAPDESPLPDQPNRAAAVSWLTMAHRDVWDRHGWWDGERARHTEMTNAR